MSRVMSSHSWRFSLLLCICANFVASEARRKSGENHDIDSSRSLPAYAIASNADLLNSTTCRKELTDFRYAVDQRILWALKMLDAGGRLRAGFIYGNNFWLGSRSQCLDTMNPSPLQLAEREIANNTLYRDPRQESPPFGINYFVAHFRHNSTLQYHVKVHNEDLVTLGLCLPLSCSTKELGFILEKIFRDRVLLVGDLYSADFRLVAVRDLRDDHRWLFNGAALFIGSILAFTWFLMITGTMYDVYQRYLKAQNRLSAYPLGRISSSQKAPSSCDLGVKSESENTEATASSLLRTGRIAQVLICFSVYTNSRIIFSIKQHAASIPSIHGLRSVSMIWVILVHTLYYSADYIDNRPLGLRISEGFIAQIISNSTLAVDTYFCMSGFLLAHIYLNIHGADEKRTGAIDYGAKLKEFFVFLIRRFMRLTPAYAMTIGIVYLSASWYSRNSQFYMSERSHEVCAKYWWRNLLYISNLFSRDTMCISWSWYLSNDTQFFVIGLIVLILSTVCFQAAAVMLFTLLIGTIVLSGYLSYVNGFVPTLDEQYRLLDVLYDRPWTRIGPYIIGMIAAYVVFKVNNGLVLRRKTVIFFWCLGSACNIFTLFGTYKRHISVLTAAFYVALNRTCWAVGVAWILIACSTKHGGILNKFLSFRGWLPLSRLTYCAYLVNPLVINSFRLDSESSAHVDTMPVVVIFFGYWTLSYVYAYALSLMSEAPYVQLMKQLQPGSTWQQKQKRRTKEIMVSRVTREK